MANTKLPQTDNPLASSQGFLETIQTPRLRAGGPSSSGLLNTLVDRIKRDLSRLAIDVSDSTDQARLLAQMVNQQGAGLARMYGSLTSQMSGLAGISADGHHKALADFSLNACTVMDSSLTGADINPLFGQAILPARTRQNCLVIERGPGEPPAIPSDAALLVSLQPNVTSTTGATAPADYTFGEDPDSVNALDNNDLTPWLVADPTQTGHMAWLEIQLPGNVSGAYRCNELEFIPATPFSMSLVSVQAEIIGQGWQDLDFSYLTGYDNATRSVIGLGPSRLCFSEASIRRFRLGLWVSGTWGFSRIRVLSATYQSTSNVTVNFSSYSPSSLISVKMIGKNPQALSYLTANVTGSQVTATLTPNGSSSESPVLSGIACTW